MKRFLGIIAVFGVVSFGVVGLLCPNDVRVLGEFDFSHGEWKLKKGYCYGDSIQYVITDNDQLQMLKDVWVLSRTDSVFATTGGYWVTLYKGEKEVIFMDIIIDSEQDMSRSGILANSQYGTLVFKDLNWLRKGNWRVEDARGSN